MDCITLKHQNRQIVLSAPNTKDDNHCNEINMSVSIGMSSHIHTPGYTPTNTFNPHHPEIENLLVPRSWQLDYNSRVIIYFISKSSSEVGAPMERILLATVTMMIAHGCWQEGKPGFCLPLRYFEKSQN
jgi:hypothetical protein